MNRIADFLDRVAKHGPTIDRVLVDVTVLAVVGMSCLQLGKIFAPAIMP